MRSETEHVSKTFAQTEKRISMVVGNPVQRYPSESGYTAHWRIPYSGFSLKLLHNARPNNSINLVFAPDGSDRNLTDYQPLIERLVDIFRSQTRWTRSHLMVGEATIVWGWWTKNRDIATAVVEQLTTDGCCFVPPIT